MKRAGTFIEVIVSLSIFSVILSVTGIFIFHNLSFYRKTQTGVQEIMRKIETEKKLREIIKCHYKDFISSEKDESVLEEKLKLCCIENEITLKNLNIKNDIVSLFYEMNGNYFECIQKLNFHKAGEVIF